MQKVPNTYGHFIERFMSASHTHCMIIKMTASLTTLTDSSVYFLIVAL
ncbi:hypothetical protein [Marinagarivorans algicola]|nr:hypothetical protein [Marinagarivorans algicola]